MDSPGERGQNECIQMIRAFFAAFLVLHGLIHLIGFSKAFGFVAVPQLGQPISRVEGLVWLVATGLFVASAVALYASPRRFWMVGAAALVLSQTLICGSWRDAKFGTVASLVVLVGVSYGFLSRGPWSFRATFENDAWTGLARRSPQPLVTEADLAPLPEPVRRYLRAAGVVVEPFERGSRARFPGSAVAAWATARSSSAMSAGNWSRYEPVMLMSTSTRGRLSSSARKRAAAAVLSTRSTLPPLAPRPTSRAGTRFSRPPH